MYTQNWLPRTKLTNFKVISSLLYPIKIRAFKISRWPPELRLVPRGSPTVTLFRTSNINNIQSCFSSTWPTFNSQVIFENDVHFCKTTHIFVLIRTTLNSRKHNQYSFSVLNSRKQNPDSSSALQNSGNIFFTYPKHQSQSP